MKRLLLVLAVTMSAVASHAAAETWHTYRDTAHGFAISYPDGWTVNPQYADRGYGYSQGETDDVRISVGLSPTIDLAPGTNLESRQLVLAVQTTRPGDSCKASAFLADPPPDYFTQTVEDTADAAHTEAHAGDLYDVEHLVRIVSRTPCLAVQVFLVYGQDRPDDPHPPPPFNRGALFSLLNQITATLQLLK
jgi:hypothetical protein